MNKERLAAGGAIGVSFLIASCCIAPAIFLLFGVSVGALGALSALEPYRPIFMVAGGMALVYAGGWIFRPARRGQPADCEDGACAPAGPARRRTRMLFAIAVVAFAAAVAYPYVIASLI